MSVELSHSNQATDQRLFALANLKGDLYGGITAAVVALPLALAFRLASGVGAIAGLYGAIFVGFFAALCGGTPSKVSGPAAPSSREYPIDITWIEPIPTLSQ